MSVVVKAGQSFPFLGQITWFIGNNRTLSQFKFRVLHKLIRPIKL